ncbi:MAG: hypothetical protein JJU29_03125 [Verrucomicrobia bacterium]|nr:hypothetical protein [Verrucomicrobiota bacterium]MCH8511166.1 hypothetical protein [Kiritimatiellia bacterium]
MKDFDDESTTSAWWYMKLSKSFYFLFILYYMFSVSANGVDGNANSAEDMACPMHMYAEFFGEFMELTLKETSGTMVRGSCTFENQDLSARMYFVDHEITAVETLGLRGFYEFAENYSVDWTNGLITHNFGRAEVYGTNPDEFLSTIILVFEDRTVTYNAENLAQIVHQMYQEGEKRKAQLQHAYILSAVLFVLLCLLFLYARKIRRKPVSDHADHSSKKSEPKEGSAEETGDVPK